MLKYIVGIIFVALVWAAALVFRGVTPVLWTAVGVTAVVGLGLVAIDLIRMRAARRASLALESGLAGQAAESPPHRLFPLYRNLDTFPIQVQPTTGPQDEATTQLLDRLRTETLPPVDQQTGAKSYVGGTTAITADFSSVMQKAMPLFLAVVVGLGFILIARKNAATYELPYGSFLGVAGLAVAMAMALRFPAGFWI